MRCPTKFRTRANIAGMARSYVCPSKFFGHPANSFFALNEND